MISEVNIISRKLNLCRVRGSRGALSPSAGGFRRQNPHRKFLASKQYLDLLQIDLIAAKIITVEDNKFTISAFADNTKRPKMQDTQLGKVCIFCHKNQQRGLGSRREHCWGYVFIYGGSSSDISFSYFFCLSKVWRKLQHGFDCMFLSCHIRILE